MSTLSNFRRCWLANGHASSIQKIVSNIFYMFYITVTWHHLNLTLWIRNIISPYQIINLSTNVKHSVKNYKHWVQNMWSWMRAKKQFAYQKLTEESKNEKQTRCDTCQVCNCQRHSNKGDKDNNKKSWNIVIIWCSRKVEHIWNVLYTYMHKNKKLTFC